MPDTARDYANKYARLGWLVFPCWRTDANGKCQCSHAEKCANPGKHPRTHHGFMDATTDPKKIKLWKWESANVGIRTGKESGLVVIDVDPRHGGKDTLQALLERLGTLPPGPIACTGGGGWHLVFQHPGHTVAIASKSGLADGIDVRADGGFIVAPPSVHKSGHPYLWKKPLNGEPLPELPQKWLEFVGCYTECTECTECSECSECSEISRNAPEVTRSVVSEYQNDDVSLFSEIIRRSLPTRAGERHAKIFQLARRLKAHPDLAAKPADEFLGVVRQWHEAALDKIGTKEFEPTWADFKFSWEEAKYPWGTGPMEEIFAKALQEEPPAKAAALYGPTSLRTQLAALCRALQRAAGDKDFFLSTRQVADALKISSMHAGRWLQRLCADGLLRRTNKGTLREHQASEFRYLGD